MIIVFHCHDSTILFHIFFKLSQFCGPHFIQFLFCQQSGEFDNIICQFLFLLIQPFSQKIVSNKSSLCFINCQTPCFFRDWQRLVDISHNKIYKQFALIQSVLIIMNRGQSKQYAISELNQYPTIKSLGSQTSLLSLKDLNECLNNLRLDASSMCMLAFQIKNSMACIQHSSQENYEYGIRLICLVRFIFQHCSLNQNYLYQLVNCLKKGNQKWKRLLVINLQQINIDPNAYKIFMYKTKRNIYLLILLRTCNTTLSKIIDKMVLKGQLNQSAINYLCQNHIFISFEKVYSKMVEIMKQRQQETYLKIHLINEFIKYVLLYRNFCIDWKDEAKIYPKFFNIMEYSFRIIKKYSHSQIHFIIENTFNLIQKGVKFYIDNLRKDGNSIKINQMQHVLRIIQQKPAKQVKDNISNQAFVIKLVLTILKNWKPVYRQAQRSRNLLQMRSIQEFNMTQQVRKQKQHKIKQHLAAGKIEQVKLQFRKLSNSLTNLQKKKSTYKSERFGSCIKMSANPQNIIKIRNDIKSDSFQNNNKNRSKQKKYDKKQSMEEHQRQLKLEDYQIQRNSRKKILPSLNKIQLYKQQKMVNFCVKKPKLKLDRKN